MMRTLSLVFGTLAVAALAFTGCGDKCDKLPCVEGTVVDCACACNTGFEGSYCHRWWTKKFTATYETATACADTSDPDHGRTNLASLIDFGPDSASTFTIVNVGNWPTDAIATMTDSVTFTVPQQVDPDYPAVTVSGSGSINSTYDVVTFNYTLSDTVSGAFKQCIMTYVKVPPHIPVIID